MPSHGQRNGAAYIIQTVSEEVLPFTWNQDFFFSGPQLAITVSLVK